MSATFVGSTSACGMVFLLYSSLAIPPLTSSVMWLLLPSITMRRLKHFGSSSLSRLDIQLSLLMPLLILLIIGGMVDACNLFYSIARFPSPRSRNCVHGSLIAICFLSNVINNDLNS